MNKENVRNFQRTLVEIETQIDDLLTNASCELEKIKNIHRVIAPLKKNSLPGLDIYSKFSAGQSAGGEFYDIIKKDTFLLLILTSAPNYKISSIVLTAVEYLREQLKKSPSSSPFTLENIFEEFISQLDSSHKQCELFLFKIDLKTLKGEGNCFGNTQIFNNQGPILTGNIYSLEKKFFKQTVFQLTLKRNDKILIVSPGVFKHFNEQNKSVEFSKSLEEDPPPHDFINDVFFNLKKDPKNEFLDYDATMIYMEVSPRAIIQM